MFAELVTQCVRAIYPAAHSIRPFPGDEGVDVFVGDFGDRVKVWQSKFFCDGIGNSQQANIRKSFKTVRGSDVFNRVVEWTLCVPLELTIDEQRWWQRWSQKESKSSGIPVGLWSRSHFIGFSARPELAQIFDVALGRTESATSADALDAMRKRPPLPLKKLPTSGMFADAIFVRKLNLAGVTQHRAERTAFYNFELLRHLIEQGGTKQEIESLEDLEIRVFDLWEELFNEHAPDRLGRGFFKAVLDAVRAEQNLRLKTHLPAGEIHKKGSLHYWADLCEAGWTANHATVARDAEAAAVATQGEDAE